MNSLQFAELASQAQDGNKASLEQLLVLIHTPVSYQCRKLLQNDTLANHMTKIILQQIPAKLNTLKKPESFETWLGTLTAKHCMQALHQQTTERTPPVKKLRIPGKHLNEQEMAMVVDQIVDTLPDGPRICITLYCCCRIPVSSISRITGFSESDMKAYLRQAQARINGRLKKLAQQGVEFAAVTSIPELLQIAMNTPSSSKASAAMAGSIPRKQPAAKPVPLRKATAPGLKIAVAVVSVLLVLMLGLIFFLERNRQTALEAEEKAAITETATLPTETMTSPTEITVCTTAAETTMETTVEPTVETTQGTTEATTQSTTEPAVVTVQSSQSVSGSNPGATDKHPSSTGSGNNSTGSGGNTTSSAAGNHTHSYQDAGPIGVTPAGCESPGSRLKICFVCGDQVRYVDEAGLPPHGHSYSSTVKAPTEGREGFTIHTCTRCGKTYMDNYVPKLPAATQPPAPEPEVSPDPVPEAAPENE